MFFKGKISHLWLLQLLADISAVVAAYYTVVLFRFHSELGSRFFSFLNSWLQVGSGTLDPAAFEAFYIENAYRIVLYLAATICTLYALHDLYPGRRYVRARPITWNITVANLTALALFYIYLYISRNTFHPRSFIGPMIVANIFFCIWFRALVRRFLLHVRTKFGMDRTGAILVGCNEDADYLYRLIGETHPQGIVVAEWIETGSLESLKELRLQIKADRQKHDADLLIVADKRLSVAQIMELLELAEELGMSAKLLSDQFNVLVNEANLNADIIHGVPLVHFEAPAQESSVDTLRRSLTLLIALASIVLFFPLLVLVAALIKLTSRGPVFFVQERIGVNRKPFQMFKFRTMFDRADEMQAEVEELNESGKALFKIRNDRRVTAVGKLLRRLSIDELPQLFNVIRGDMAIVGPRPLPRRDFANYYEEWHYSRHSGMPGLTCLWQVSGRSDLDFHSMCILDVYYLRNRNWMLDLRIVLKTFWAVLFAKGAY